jgi:hypothetical protein
MACSHWTSRAAAEIKNRYKPHWREICELKMSRAESARENGKLGGRPPGSPNKITAEIRAVAQRHAPDAFAELARLAREAQRANPRGCHQGNLLPEFGDSAATASSKGWRGNCHPGELGMALRKLGFKRERRWDAVVAFVLCGINKVSESCGRGEV